MNRSISAVAVALVALACMIPSRARAEVGAQHANGGLGFHNESAPVGVRWWLAGHDVGIDAGIGFTSRPAPLYPNEKVTGWSLDVGLPLVLKSWDRIQVLFRPGLLYSSQEVTSTVPPAPFDTENTTTFSVSGEIEAEVFLVENCSISASQGIAFDSVNPAGPGGTQTSVTTIGNNFTRVGFHIYLFGGNK